MVNTPQNENLKIISTLDTLLSYLNLCAISIFQYIILCPKSIHNYYFQIKLNGSDKNFNTSKTYEKFFYTY